MFLFEVYWRKYRIGWRMHHRQDRKIVLNAIGMAVWQRHGERSVIVHSNRGSPFRSADYQRFLKRNTLICSMSAVGHCGDNAACEGFFGILKRERTNSMEKPVTVTLEDDALSVRTARDTLSNARALMRAKNPAGKSLVDELLAERRAERACE